ncbi:MAG: topoisomerase DNA-binding C4 zinc finger domain-containing protein [Candidatus Altimarinota bacterium]
MNNYVTLAKLGHALLGKTEKCVGRTRFGYNKGFGYHRYCYWEEPCAVGNGVMVLRKGKNGLFWGCSGYPKCRATQQWNIFDFPVKVRKILMKGGL